jgi:hypothetical protein
MKKIKMKCGKNDKMILEHQFERDGRSMTHLGHGIKKWNP